MKLLVFYYSRMPRRIPVSGKHRHLELNISFWLLKFHNEAWRQWFTSFTVHTASSGRLCFCIPAICKKNFRVPCIHVCSTSRDVWWEVNSNHRHQWVFKSSVVFYQIRFRFKIRCVRRMLGIKTKFQFG